MKNADFLTGITPSGTPHLGNYVGAIRPAVESSKNKNLTSYYFLADYHSLIKNHDPKKREQSSLEIAAAWIALGLDYENCVFYRQSDIPEIPELTWILTCLTAKGLMNRAHAYKAAVQDNGTDNNQDPDKGITMGLFSYPILMAADILMFNAKKVPVGKDQVQHLESPVRPHKIGDKLIPGLGEYYFRRVILDQLSSPEDGDFVRHFDRFMDVVGNKGDGFF